MTVYFELQYYDGGLKIELIPQGPRPKCLPLPAGPQSTELEFGKDDFAIEFTTAEHYGKRIIWIGFYLHGVDRQHGPRRNSYGAGVWLVDLSPVYVAYLLDYLSGVAQNISLNTGPTAEMMARLENMAKTFHDTQWCKPAAETAQALWSSRMQWGSQGETAYILIPEDRHEAISLAAQDIALQLNVQFSETARPAARRLYLLRRSARVADIDAKALQPEALSELVSRAIADLAGIAADPMRALNALRLQTQQREAELRSELAAAREARRVESARATELEEQVSSQRKQLDAMQEEAEKFQALIRTMLELVPDAKEPDWRGFPAYRPDTSQLSDVRSRLEDIQSGVSSLLSAMTALENGLSHKPAGPAWPVETHGFNSTVPAGGETRPYYISGFIPRPWLPAVILAIAVAAIGGWFAYSISVQPHASSAGDTSPPSRAASRPPTAPAAAKPLPAASDESGLAADSDAAGNAMPPPATGRADKQIAQPDPKPPQCAEAGKPVPNSPRLPTCPDKSH